LKSLICGRWIDLLGSRWSFASHLLHPLSVLLCFDELEGFSEDCRSLRFSGLLGFWVLAFLCIFGANVIRV
jgi:hypothetical protein